MNPKLSTILLLMLVLSLSACSWGASPQPSLESEDSEEVSKVSEENSDPYDPQFLENGIEELELLEK